MKKENLADILREKQLKLGLGLRKNLLMLLSDEQIIGCYVHLWLLRRKACE